MFCLQGLTFYMAFVVSTSVSVLVALSCSQTVRSACCGLFFKFPLSSEIDELIVWLLPVCLCPGWRCPGYGWESQLWHPPWGCYCSRPAGGPGGLVAPGPGPTHILLSHPWRHSGTPPWAPLISSDYDSLWKWAKLLLMLKKKKTPQKVISLLFPLVWPVHPCLS